MDKDFDYDKFVKFMQYLGGPGAVYVHSDDPTQNIINKIDELEQHVASRPVYDSVEDMMNSIKGL
jgi:hypothetical protein